jgi:all-trans-retinol 13,14-reductase
MKGHEIVSAPGSSRRSFINLSLSTAPVILLGLLFDRCMLSRNPPLRILPAGKSSPQKIVVIGSGMTGLITGALLAKIGHMVNVLEANVLHVGGHARTLVCHGFEFCAGPQYVWNFGKGEIGNRVLHYLGIQNEITFDKMDPEGFEVFKVADDIPFRIPMGLEPFKNALCSKFPAEHGQIDKFFSALQVLFQSSKIIHDKGLYADDYGTMKWGILLSSLPIGKKIKAFRWSKLTLNELFDLCELSQPVRRILYGNGGIFAESESDVPAAVYASAIGFYHQGAYILKQGFPRLIDRLSGIIAQAGGAVEKGKQVVKVETAGARAVAVICADGSRYPSNLVVSNISPRLMRRLLPDCHLGNSQYAPSHSFITCMIGLKEYPGLHEKMCRRNYWWQGSTQEQKFRADDILKPPEMLYVGSPTANGIIGASGPQDGQSLIVFAPGNYEQEMDFHASGRESRLRKILADNLVARIEGSLLPDIRRHLLFAEVLTSIDIETALGAEKGNAYGRRLTVREILSGVKPDFGIKNLRFACATVGLPGIATSFNTAALLVKNLTGVRI